MKLQWESSIAIGLTLMGGCAPRPCTPPLCDTRDTQCQQQIMAAAACLRDVPARAIKTRIISAETYLDERMSSASAVDKLRFEQRSAALELLGLELAYDYDSAIEASVNRVGAFYNPSDDSVTVLERGGPSDSIGHVLTLVHEYSHALQRPLLEAGSRRESLTFDQWLAYGAMVEGDVTLTTDRAATLLFGDDPDRPNWRRIYRGWTATAREDYLHESLRVSLADRYFLYAFGTAFLEPVYREQGQAGIDDWLRDPPLTTRAVMAGVERAQAEDERTSRVYDRAQWQSDAASVIPGVGDSAVASDGGNDAEASPTSGVLLTPFKAGQPLLVPSLPGFTPLTVDSLGEFVFEAFARDFTGRISATAEDRRRVTNPASHPVADHLSLWFRSETNTTVAIYRLALPVAVESWKAVFESNAPGSAPVRVAVVEGDLVLVASADETWLATLDMANLAWTAVDSAEVPSELRAAPNSVFSW